MTRTTKFLLNCEFLFLITLNLVNIALIFGFECLKDSDRNSYSCLCSHIAVIMIRRVALTVSVVIGVIILKTRFYFMIRIVCLALLQM